MAKQPVAIVTGAGSGIGREVCRLFAADNYRIALVGRRERLLHETIEHMQHDEALTLTADLAEPESAHKIADRVMEQWGRVDVLVNNAGRAGIIPLEKITWSEFEHSFAVNLFGPGMLIATLWPTFQKQRSGCVVNVSSMSTIDPFPGLSVYGAAKAGLESLTRSIVNEGQSFGIRAFSIAPGAVETDMLRSMFSTQQLPAKHTLDPAEVATVIVECIWGKRDADIGRTITLPNR